MEVLRDSQPTSSKTKSDGALEEKWSRKGLFRFTFNIQTMDDKTNLGTKEAHDHAFSHKTSNWGWAQFAKRDHVYYKNTEVIRDDGFLISVTITSSPEKPKIAKPVSHTVPPVLVHAMGSLLDDPEHSDVVFYLYSSRRRGQSKTRKADVKKVYAIRKILAARSEYFRDMFESGFQEAEAEESSSSEEEEQTLDRSRTPRVQQAPAHPHGSHHAAARAEQAKQAVDSEEEEDHRISLEEFEEGEGDDEDDEPDIIMDDSDEDVEDEDSVEIKHASQSYLREDNSPNEDEEEEVDDDEDHFEERVDDDAVETDDEGEANVTGNDGFSASPEVGKLSLKAASSRHSSTAFVDATANQAAERARSTSGSEQSSLMVDREEAARTFAPHPSKPTSSPSSSVTAKMSSRAKRDRSRAHEAVSMRTKQTSGNGKQGSGIHHRKRRKVSIVDSAYPTFKALLFFLYTDTVEFAPLTSSFLPSDVAADVGPTASLFANPAVTMPSSRRGREPSGRFLEEMQKARKKRKGVIEAHRDRYPDKPGPCSAKAMYRLADKLDIPDLKKRAQEHIAMSLTIQNIVWEVFSGFTAQYADILKMETDFLLKHWPQVKRVNAMKSIFLRSSAHPGLAKVWPYLLDCLEYRQPEVDDTDETAL